jgi:hypothetical protein
MKKENFETQINLVDFTIVGFDENGVAYECCLHNEKHIEIVDKIKKLLMRCEITAKIIKGIERNNPNDKS